MKKVLLTMVGALVFMSMMAATGADKKDGVKTPVSRVDLVTQTEMLMSALSSDGFGLDAEEYELLMGQDFEMMDDMSMTFTVPTYAGGDVPSLNGAGAGGWGDSPIIRIRTHGAVTRDETDGGFDDNVKGNVRPGNEPNVVPGGEEVNGSRPTKPIGPGPIDF